MKICGNVLRPLARLIISWRRSGVVVASTAARGIDAREGGLAAGDVVYAVNQKPVGSLGALRAALDELKSGDSIVLHLERRGELMFLAFTVE